MTVNILGAEYQVNIKEREEDARLNTRDGYTDFSTKRIVVVDFEKEKDENSVDDLSPYFKKIIRHETIHALFHESGLDDWAEKEKLVDWIALQIPKIIKVWEELKAL